MEEVKGLMFYGLNQPQVLALSTTRCKARFAFSRGEVVHEVPYDPHLAYVSFGFIGFIEQNVMSL